MPNWLKPSSRLGWGMLGAYLILAFFAFREALTCSGWACDPAAFPLGFPIAWFIDWLDSLFGIPSHVVSVHFRNWYYIVPTVTANAVFYYFAGSLLAVVIARRHSRRSGR